MKKLAILLGLAFVSVAGLFATSQTLQISTLNAIWGNYDIKYSFVPGKNPLTFGLYASYDSTIPNLSAPYYDDVNGGGSPDHPDTYLFAVGAEIRYQFVSRSSYSSSFFFDLGMGGGFYGGPEIGFTVGMDFNTGIDVQLANGFYTGFSIGGLLPFYNSSYDLGESYKSSSIGEQFIPTFTIGYSW